MRQQSWKHLKIKTTFYAKVLIFDGCLLPHHQRRRRRIFPFDFKDAMTQHFLRRKQKRCLQKSGFMKTTMMYGYARVSTGGQSLEAQLAQLTARGCRIYAEKISGAATNRPQLAKLMHAMRPGDVVVVTRLDRLARSTRDLLNLLAQMSERGVGFRSLADEWADTTTPHGRLMVTLLGGIAEFERELIRTRTAEGRARALARGVKMGRPAKLDPVQQLQVVECVLAGSQVSELAARYRVSESTIARIARVG